MSALRHRTAPPEHAWGFARKLIQKEQLKSQANKKNPEKMNMVKMDWRTNISIWVNHSNCNTPNCIPGAFCCGDSFKTTLYSGVRRGHYDWTNELKQKRTSNSEFWACLEDRTTMNNSILKGMPHESPGFWTKIEQLRLLGAEEHSFQDLRSFFLQKPREAFPRTSMQSW